MGSLKESKEFVIAPPKGFIRSMQNNMGNNNVNEYSPFAIAFVFMLAVPHSQHVQSSVNSFGSFICGNTSRRSNREDRTQEADTKWNRLTLFVLFSHYLNSKLIDQRLIVWHNRIDCWLKRNFNWPIFICGRCCVHIFRIFCKCFLLVINAKLSQNSKERSRKRERESPNWVSEQLNQLKSKWKSAKWCKQTSSMWRALIGSNTHEEWERKGGEERGESSKKLIKRRHYLISSSCFRMWLINL